MDWNIVLEFLEQELETRQNGGGKEYIAEAQAALDAFTRLSVKVNLCRQLT